MRGTGNPYPAAVLALTPTQAARASGNTGAKCSEQEVRFAALGSDERLAGIWRRARWRDAQRAQEAETGLRLRGARCGVGETDGEKIFILRHGKAGYKQLQTPKDSHCRSERAGMEVRKKPSRSGGLSIIIKGLSCGGKGERILSNADAGQCGGLTMHFTARTNAVEFGVATEGGLCPNAETLTLWGKEGTS